MLQMFYQSAVASVLFYDAVCWGGIRNTDAGRLVRKVGFVIGTRLDALGDVVERCTPKMLEPVTLISHFIFMEQKQQYWRILVSLLENREIQRITPNHRAF